MKTIRRFLLLPFATVALFGIAATPTLANAEEAELHSLHEPTAYPIEVEPHFTFGPDNVYGDSGFGAGVRLGVPVAVGHIGRLPQNLAISFGGDWIHYDNCYYGNYCSANYLMVPVAVQWNVGVLRPLSLFLEGGASVYKGWFDGCAPGDSGCYAPSDFGLLPTFAIGGRIHVADEVAITLRLGYPTTTLGVSFL